MLNKIFLSTLLAVGLVSCSTPEPRTEVVIDQKYQEPHRPQYHFTPDSMWMNDPNGMVYYEGEYHLFYQFYPDSNVWGPMHWGHAVSDDMVHWEHLPIALYPDSLGLIFSGSAVIDHENTSGLGTADNPPMVAIFTHHSMEGEQAGTNTFQYQSIAYSLDKGRSWTKYEGNPVVPNPGIRDFRDPKVRWHEPTQSWVMVLAAYDKAMFYTSPNLRDWTFASEFGIEGDTRLWECPDLFPLKHQESGEEKWILITSIQKDAPNGGTATSYFVGDFDGKAFMGDPAQQQWLDYGTDNYALVTWSNVPDEDGRTLALGWMSNWQYATVVPTERWRSAMTVPRSLHLVSTGSGYRVESQPVEELHDLRGEKVSFETSGAFVAYELEGIDPGQVELELALTWSEGTETVALKLSNEAGDSLLIGYHPNEGELFIDRRGAGLIDFNEHFAGIHTAPLQIEENELELHLFLDLSSVEVFANGGERVMTDIFFPRERMSKAELFVEGGKAQLVEGGGWQMGQIW